MIDYNSVINTNAITNMQYTLEGFENVQIYLLFSTKIFNILYKKAFLKINNILIYFLLKHNLLIKAKESDAAKDEDGVDDLIDKITIPDMDTAVAFRHSTLHTVQCEKGIGNFTLIYYNLTTGKTAVVHQVQYLALCHNLHEVYTWYAVDYM